MKKKDFEARWDILDWRILILYDYCEDRCLIEIGKSLGMGWFEGRNKLNKEQKQTAAWKIGERVEEPHELEELINGCDLSIEITSAVSGLYYHALGYKGDVKIEGTRFFNAFKDIRRDLKEMSSENTDILPLIRGILLSSEVEMQGGCGLKTTFYDAVKESKRFYDYDEFCPEEIKKLPGDIHGLYARHDYIKGQKYLLDICIAHVIWDALEYLERK